MKGALLALIFLALGAVGGYCLSLRWLAQHPHESRDERFEIRDDENSYRFVNPLLECDLAEQYISTNWPRPTRDNINKTIDDIKASGKASFVSYYYRDLNNGPWIGINEREKFFPASMLKIPLMLHYFRQAEFNPAILDEQIAFNAPSDIQLQQYFKPAEVLQLNTSYTIRELIDRAIRYSDNDSAVLLSNRGTIDGLPPLQSVFRDLHVVYPTSNSADFMSVRDYSIFFRILFNASYLNPEWSEKALELTTRTAFNKALTAKLPSDIIVAHKFGEHYTDNSTEKQLHDCGIVYLPKHPYAICIMTRGTDFELMADAIADLSKATFDEIMRGLKR